MHTHTIQVLFGVESSKVRIDDVGNAITSGNGETLPVYFRYKGDLVRAGKEQADEGLKLYVVANAEADVWEAADIPDSLPLPQGATKADAAKWLTGARDLDVRSRTANPLKPAGIKQVRELVAKHISEQGDVSLAMDMAKAFARDDNQWFRDYYEAMTD